MCIYIYRSKQRCRFQLKHIPRANQLRKTRLKLSPLGFEPTTKYLGSNFAHVASYLPCRSRDTTLPRLLAPVPSTCPSEVVLSFTYHNSVRDMIEMEVGIKSYTGCAPDSAGSQSLLAVGAEEVSPGGFPILDSCCGSKKRSR